MRLFVYGLLRPGFEGAELLGTARSLGAATTQGLLYDLGGFPGLVAGDGRVQGELCEVAADRLPAIDAFEDYDPDDPAGSLYIRRTVTVWLAGTTEALDAAAYCYNRCPPPAGWIADGDYWRYRYGPR
jgi:gamma-glutamylcyclotransferase (GGCT)/AIG2-like uncharacterized protein YtfP